MRRGLIRSWGGAVAVGLVAAAGAILASSASAYIYWADNPENDGTTIGRAENDGSGVNRNFITGLDGPCGVVVDDQHIYWGNRGTNSIGRANLDGTGVETNFIPVGGGFGSPCGPSIGGGKLWWANLAGGTGGEGAVARANLDGSSPQPGFFASPTSAHTPFTTAAGGGFVYWSNTDISGPSPIEPAIGRAGPDGTPPPNPNALPLSGSQFFPVWLAADDSNLFISLLTFGGAGAGVFRVDHGLGSGNFITQFSASGGVALHGGKFYVANGQEGTITRMNPDGTGVEPTIVTRAGTPTGLAVDGRSTPPGQLTVGKLTRNKRKGTGKLALTVNGPGAVALEGDGVKPATVQAPGAGDVELPIRATGSKRKALKRKGKVKLKAELSFTPAQGTPDSESAKLKLKRK